MPQTQDIPKLTVPELRAQIDGGNADPQVVAFNVERYRTLLANATAVRDEQTMDILGKAIEEFSVAGEPQLVEPTEKWNHPLQQARTVLKAAGYESLNAAAKASDEELLAVKGIGPAKLKQIREAFPKA